MISREEIERYLRAQVDASAAVESVESFGRGAEQHEKAYGYGRPLLVRYVAAGLHRICVVRTMAADPFNHDRRADRLAAFADDAALFNGIPRHVRAWGAGVVTSEGTLVPLPAGEPFLVTDYVAGRLYAEDLRDLAGAEHLGSLGRARVRALAAYLAELHSEARPPESYARDLRDTVGHGEGIFGLIDSYRPADPVATPRRLEALEVAAVRYRHRLASKSHRARRKHGDFHPFNILFREGTDFSVLDASRGAAGDSADDVSCLTINYLYFAHLQKGRFTGPLRDAWDELWGRYLDETGDSEILFAVPLYFTWRALVLASPLWYPDTPAPIRDHMLSLAERYLGGVCFDPREVS